MSDDPEITDPRDPHKRRDIVDALDLWLTARRTTENAHAFAPISELLHRARDEIVALREMRDAHIRILSASLDEDEENMRRWIAKARDEALEEAAHECDEEAKGSGGEVAFRDGCETCAAAIRLLKEKR